MIEKCGPGCVSESPLLDTADGREHDNCLDDDGDIDWDEVHEKRYGIE